MGQAVTATPLGATSPARRRGVSAWAEYYFKWLMVAPGDAADPRLLDLPAPVFAMGRVRQLRLSNSGTRFRRAAELSAGHRRSAGVVVARPNDRALARSGRNRVRPRAFARVGDGENFPRPGDRHVDPDHPAVHKSGDRRPILGVVSATAVRACGLPPEPTRGPPGGDQLDRRSPLGLYLDRCRRRLAVDPVHVRDPARRPCSDTAAHLRGRRAGRGRRFPDFPLRDHAPIWRR